jgi:hypothetical protein
MNATTTAAPASAASLVHLIRQSASAKEIELHLERLTPQERVREVLAIVGKDVGRLYDAVAEAPPLTFEDIVPAGASKNETFIFEGRNSLPMFSRFQKRFARAGEGIVGFNQQTMSFFTGPGYFVVKAASGHEPNPTELFFDYTIEPGAMLEGWPAYKANDRGFSRGVYMDMTDYMRRVCKGVMVGRAYKKGIPQSAYFSLSLGR